MKEWIKSFLQNFVKNLKNIIFALIIAITVWFAISMQIFPDVTTHVSDIPVEVKATEYMTKNALSVTNSYVDKITVQVTGKRYEVGNLTASDFTASADLSAITAPGEYKVKVNVTPVKDNSCTVDDEGLSVKLKVEKTVSKTFSISDGSMKAVAEGITATAGMKIDSVTAEPSTITLTGDSTAIDAVKSVEIRSVFAGETSESVSSKGQIVLLGSNGDIIENPDIKYDNESYTVNITLYKQKTLPLTVQFTNVPSNFDLSSLKYSIYPESLTVSSPDDSLDSQEKFEIGTIDLSQLTTKYLQKLTLPIALPEGYKNISGNTSAMVSFEDAENYTFLSYTVQKENIRIINAPDNFDVDVLTNELSVNVTGPADEIAALASKDIYATIDLMGTTLTAGLKDVTAEFTLRGTKVRSWVTGEYKVSIQVTERAEDTAD